MPAKDYYKILELTPAATVADIKKSFRRLALLYHPDTNFGSKVHETKFKEIKEAYEVLSDARQRQDYNRERNDRPYTQKKNTYQPPAAETILSQTIDLRKKIAVLDPYRMNKHALYRQIQHLLAIQNIILLKHYNNTAINKQIIDEIIFCSQFLPFPYVEKICAHLTELAGTDNETFRKIYHFSKEARFHTFWNKYKFAAAVVVALILCILIYAFS